MKIEAKCVTEDKSKNEKTEHTCEAKAIAGFRDSGFYNMGLLPGYKYGDNLSKHLKAVKCELLLTGV